MDGNRDWAGVILFVLHSVAYFVLSIGLLYHTDPKE